MLNNFCNLSHKTPSFCKALLYINHAPMLQVTATIAAHSQTCMTCIMCIMRGGRAFCCSALLVIFIALQGPQGNIFHLNKGLNAHTTVWSAFSGRSSSTSQENHVQDARPVWSLSHGLIVAFLNINGVHSIYYFRRPALVCTVFLHGKIKRTKCPCAYYSNSSATFHIARLKVI